jgi:hypothetical protein
MDVEIRVAGDIVERSELLNGTRTIAIEGETLDAQWQVGGVVSWNRGLVDYPGDGDLSVTSADGEVFASLTAASAEAESDDESADVLVLVKYEVDGGAGRFDGATGTIDGRIRVAGERFEGTWQVSLREPS